MLKLSNLTAVSALFQQATASTAENSGKNTHNVKNIATIRCSKNYKLLTHRKKEIFRSKTFKNLHKNTPSDFHCYFRARACDIAHAQMGIVLNRKWIERTSVSLVGEAHFLQNVAHEVGGLEHILSQFLDENDFRVSVTFFFPLRQEAKTWVQYIATCWASSHNR